MQGILLAVVLQAGALSSFPRNAGGAITGSAIGLALGGSPAVVAVAGERVVAYRADGSSPPGFPFSLGAGETAAGSPAAADMDGDGKPEIAVVTLSGKLFLWGDGRVLPGFPLALGARVRAGPSFADLDGGGRRQVLVGDDKGRLHAFSKGGKEAKGWPATLGAAVTSSAASARFAGGPSVAVGCQDGRVHVLDGSGRARAGFPLRTEFEVTGAPAFADLDDDGSLDLVVASQDYKLYAVGGRGQPLAGFPVAAGYRIYDGPAIADLLGDGTLDVVFASADGLVHAVSGSGAKLPGWPVRVGQRLFGGPAIGDVDRDGRQEVVVVTSDGQVVALSAEGKVVSGFPALLEAQDLAATPLLYDLTQDGSLSIFVGAKAGELHALRAERQGASPAIAAWPGPAHDAARTGRFGPSPGRYRDLALAPAGPRTGDKLVAQWRYTSLDAPPGGPEPAANVEWFRDGKPVPELKGRREIPPHTARKGERWAFALASAAGAPRSPEVRIQNTPPGPPEVALDPPRPARDVPVKLLVRRPAADDDGDAIQYKVEWLLDGLPSGVTGTVFPGEKLRKGVLLTARVTAGDGEAEAEPVTADAFVRNTAPGPLLVALAPAAPRRADPIQARIARPATDVDGDPVTYRFRWKVDGEPLDLPLASDTLPPGLARKHQRVGVEARAFDGLLEGPFSQAEVEIANTPPGTPQVDILPHAPRRGDTLRAVLTAEASDG